MKDVVGRKSTGTRGCPAAQKTMETPLTEGHILFAINFLEYHCSTQTPEVDNNRETLIFFALSILDICGAGTLVPSLSQFAYGFPRLVASFLENGAPPLLQNLQSLVLSLIILFRAAPSVVASIKPRLASLIHRSLLIVLDCYDRERHVFFDTPFRDGPTDLRNTYSAALILHGCIILRREVIESAPDEAMGSVFTILTECARSLPRYRHYDGMYAMLPGSESHAGATFCAVNFLALLRRHILPEVMSVALSSDCHELGNIYTDVFASHRLAASLLELQSTGFSGRRNKPTCLCYCLWTFGSLITLRCEELVSRRPLVQYINSCVHVEAPCSETLRSMAEKAFNQQSSMTPLVNSRPLLKTLAACASTKERNLLYLGYCASVLHRSDMIIGFTGESGSPDPLHVFAALFALSHLGAEEGDLPRNLRKISSVSLLVEQD